MPDIGFYLLMIPVPDSDEIHQIPFSTIGDLLLWLECDWGPYHDWLVGDSGEVIPDDVLYVDFVGSDGVQYRDSLVTRSETGELVVN